MPLPLGKQLLYHHYTLHLEAENAALRRKNAQLLGVLDAHARRASASERAALDAKRAAERAQAELRAALEVARAETAAGDVTSRDEERVAALEDRLALTRCLPAVATAPPTPRRPAHAGCSKSTLGARQCAYSRRTRATRRTCTLQKRGGVPRLVERASGGGC